MHWETPGLRHLLAAESQPGEGRRLQRSGAPWGWCGSDAAVRLRCTPWSGTKWLELSLSFCGDVGDVGDVVVLVGIIVGDVVVILMIVSVSLLVMLLSFL